MNRITNMKAIRRGSAAAIVAALVAGGAGIAGASANSTNANTRGVAASTLTARTANHDHGKAHIHAIEGVISSVSGSTSMIVTTKFGPVTVAFTSATVFKKGDTTLTSTDLATALIAGQRVVVTPQNNDVTGSTQTSFTAATVRVIPTKVHPIEGMITSLANGTSPMVVTTHGDVTVPVTLVSGTTVTMDHLNLSNILNPQLLLAVGERVNVTPASTSTTATFVAKTIKIQSTKVHPVEGTIQLLTTAAGATLPTSMTLTTSKNGTVPVAFGPETMVDNGGIVSPLTTSNLGTTEHVNVTLVPGATPTSTPVALLVKVQTQS